MSQRARRRVQRLLLVLALTLLPCALVLARQTAPASALDALRSVPTAAGVTIQPRLLAAYGALLAAATLGVLYLYRGRSFIVYWIGAWLLLAAALAILSRGYDNATLQNVASGLSLLLVVWSAGLMLLAARAFPNHALRWTQPIRVAAATAVWFFAAPFAVPTPIIVFSGALVATCVLGWSAVLYLRLARRSRYAGALLVGAGLGLIGLVNVIAVGALLYAGTADAILGRGSAPNVVVSVFVALGMHLLVFEDMTQELRRANLDLAAANDEVRRLAITDPLTGCHNRRFFDEIERREMQRHRRYGAPLAVVFVDVNHFKRLNDTLGHDRGDDVLRAIGALLRRQVRESDYVIRWGGDEFLLLLACTEADGRRKAADLKEAVDRAQELAGLPLPRGISLSIGVAAVSKHAESLQDAIREADARMYRDKTNERAAL